MKLTNYLNSFKSRLYQNTQKSFSLKKINERSYFFQKSNTTWLSIPFSGSIEKIAIKTFNYNKYFVFLVFCSIYTSYQKNKRLYCYQANDKEINKMKSIIEKEIDNLEFKYQGNIRRQPVKYNIH